MYTHLIHSFICINLCNCGSVFPTWVCVNQFPTNNISNQCLGTDVYELVCMRTPQCAYIVIFILFFIGSISNVVKSLCMWPAKYKLRGEIQFDKTLNVILALDWIGLVWFRFVWFLDYFLKYVWLWIFRWHFVFSQALSNVSFDFGILWNFELSFSAKEHRNQLKLKQIIQINVLVVEMNTHEHD